MLIAFALSSNTPTDAYAAIVRHIEALDRLMRIGMMIARAMGRDVAGALAGRGDFLRAARGYERVARAVRLVGALQRKLIDDLRRLARGEPVLETAPRARTVRPKAEPSAEPVERPERAKRREAQDRFGPILRRPLEEIVARICRDLGVVPEWRHLVEEAWSNDEVDLDRIAEVLAAPMTWRRGRAASGPARPADARRPTLAPRHAARSPA